MPIEIFFSYAHEDEEFRDGLEKHLSALERQDIISIWHDGKIGAGMDFQEQINSHLSSASIILLLISGAFLRSDNCSTETKRAMERHKAGEARVIPVILKPCSWRGASFGKLVALPKDGKEVTKWRLQDEAFTNVVEGIRSVIQELGKTKHSQIKPSLETTTVHGKAEVRSDDDNDSNQVTRNKSVAGSQELHAWNNTSSTSPHTVSYSSKTKRRIWQIIVALSTVITIFVFVTGIPDVTKLISTVRAYFANSTPSTLPPIIQELVAISDADALRDKLDEYNKRGKLAIGSRDDFANPDSLFVFVLGETRVYGIFLFHDNGFWDLKTKTRHTDLPEHLRDKQYIWVIEANKLIQH